MQYAHVIVNRRLTHLSLLTYAIPERLLAHVKAGSFVEVPLNNRPVSAIIVKFSSSVPKNVRILPLIRIVSSGPVVTEYHLHAYSQFASVTLSSLSDVLFNFLPPTLKSLNVSLTYATPQNARGVCTIFQGTTCERFRYYRSLCSSNTSTLIFLFPDYDILNQFSRFIHNIPFSMYDSRQSASKRWEMWQKIHTDKGIYITTRVGIGMFPAHPTHIIIDNPTHPGYKEDRRPKYQIQECIDIHAKRGHTITCGVHHPSIVLDYLCKSTRKTTLPPILITRSKEIIPSQTIERITRCKRVLIIVPHKNEWGLLICKECKTVVRCPQCGRVAQQVDSHNIVCVRCARTVDLNGICTKCQSTRIHRYSIGTKGLARIFKKRFPNKTVECVDVSDDNKSRVLGNDDIIVIATQKICDYPVTSFDHVVCLVFDPILDIPTFIQEEKIMNLLVTFFKMGRSGEVLTSRPLHRVHHALASNTVDILQKTLTHERGLELPPQSRFIELRSKQEISHGILSSFPGKIISQKIIKNTQSVTLSLNRDAWRLGELWCNTLPSYIRIDPDPRAASI